MKLVAAGFGYGVDDAAGCSAKLSVKLVGEHLKLGYWLQSGSGLSSGALTDDVVVIVGAVEQVIVVARILTIDADGIWAKRFCAYIWHNTGNKTHKANEISVNGG